MNSIILLLGGSILFLSLISLFSIKKLINSTVSDIVLEKYKDL
jgi:hypothetical protein